MPNLFLPLQAQSFSLAGSGAIIGATTLTLKSMTTIDGALVTMAMLGTYTFMTIEPGNGVNEEQIKFTGITQNANGTASLTGVSSVSFGTPYTVTSGLLKTHAGSVTAILSNTSGFYNSFVAKDDNGTISEVLTFTTPNFPQMDGIGTPPTLPAQLSTKQYVDSVVTGGAPNASDTAIGITKLSVAPVSPTNPIAFGKNDPAVMVTSSSAYIRTGATTTYTGGAGIQTIGHGLGFSPRHVKINACKDNGNAFGFMDWTPTNGMSSMNMFQGGTSPFALSASAGGYGIILLSGTNVMAINAFAVDATSMYITWGLVNGSAFNIDVTWVAE
jgi:hypothetical protein